MARSSQETISQATEMALLSLEANIMDQEMTQWGHEMNLLVQAWSHTKLRLWEFIWTQANRCLELPSMRRVTCICNSLGREHLILAPWRTIVDKSTCKSNKVRSNTSRRCYNRISAAVHTGQFSILKRKAMTRKINLSVPRESFTIPKIRSGPRGQASTWTQRSQRLSKTKRL